MHVGLGSVRKLSVLRDTPVDIPGHGTQKINAAYAFGGAPLMIKTVEAYLGNGLEINHIVEVSFEDFPDFIDALGGIDVKLDDCIQSNSFGGKRVRLSKGEHHLDGKDALAFARVRENECDLVRGRPRARRAPAAGHERDPRPDPVAVDLNASLRLPHAP